MDNQTLFDNAWKHFIDGKAEPAFRDHCCWFRMQDGRRCAIGISIPDAEYRSVIEHLPMGKVMEMVPVLSGSPYQFLLDLQDCHDVPARDGLTGDAFRVEFNRHMHHLATRHGLTVPA